MTGHPAGQMAEERALAVVEGASRALVASQAAPGAADLVARDKAQELRRAEREAHHHKQIWTKDPHGGPYKKSGYRTGYDPLLEAPCGDKLPVPLGYERPASGPTTNFVGNHMTQGAIDLVQAELTQRNRQLEAAQLAHYRRHYRPPQLLSHEPAPAPAARQQRSINRYRWADQGELVEVCAEVEVPLGSVVREQDVCCNFEEHSLRLTVRISRPALPASQDDASAASSPAEGAPASASSTVSLCQRDEAGYFEQHTLHIARLHAAVVPAQCKCCTSGCLLDRPHGSGSADDPVDLSALVAPAAVPPQRQCVVARLLLAKADAAQPWPQLTGEAYPPRPPVQAAEAGAKVDLAALRRALIHQRDHKRPGDGLLMRPPPPALPAPPSSGDAAADPTGSPANDEACQGPPPDGVTQQEATGEARRLAKQGAYADAVAWYSWAMMLAAGSELSGGAAFSSTSAHCAHRPQPGTTSYAQAAGRAAVAGPGQACSSERAAPVSELHLEQAVCYAELGQFRRVTQACTAALAAGCPGPRGQARALLRRGAAHEALEHWEEALADLRAALALEPTNRTVSQSVARLARALAAAQQQRQRDSQQAAASAVVRSVPHPGLAVFEPRGKAGAVF